MTRTMKAAVIRKFKRPLVNEKIPAPSPQPDPILCTSGR